MNGQSGYFFTMVQISRAGLVINPEDLALVLAQASLYCNSVLFPEWIWEVNTKGILNSVITPISISVFESGFPA